MYLFTSSCSVLNYSSPIHTSYIAAADLKCGLSWWWFSVLGHCSRSCSLRSGFAGWDLGISTCLWLRTQFGYKTFLLVFYWFLVPRAESRSKFQQNSVDGNLEHLLTQRIPREHGATLLLCQFFISDSLPLHQHKRDLIRTGAGASSIFPFFF